ncbi:hypothetical protein G3565_31155, partial [Escherichia coli]|nr:hypothetical protein [Escherichia coli]
INEYKKIYDCTLEELKDYVNENRVGKVYDSIDLIKKLFYRTLEEKRQLREEIGAVRAEKESAETIIDVLEYYRCARKLSSTLTNTTKGDKDSAS